MRKGFALLSLSLVFAHRALAQDPAAPKTEDEKKLYTVGVWLGQQAAPFNLTAAELKFVQAGLSDSVLGKKPAVDTNSYGPKLNDFAGARTQVKAEAEKKKSKAFLDNAAKEKGAVVTTSGLVYIEEKAGDGASPKATDKVKVHYEGKLANGVVFDSSISKGSPLEIPLDRVIRCWTEGVQKMKVGGKAKLVCPSDIAYGDRGAPPLIPGGAALTFQVELLGIVK